MRSFPVSAVYTDLYELTMGEVYFLQGKTDTPVCFDYFFRKLPGGSGYVLFAGLDDLLETLEELRFTEEDIAFLRELKFHVAYIEFLRQFRFRGRVHSVREGEIVFPGCPILRVEGGLFETQLVETLLLNLLNFESLIATKASRIKYVAGDRAFSDFGLRRSHGPGGIFATRAAFIGGAQSTSNVYAAEKYGLPVAGTMAHSFVESYDSELAAFRAFAAVRPDDAAFLVDTYDTLRSGVPNAILVAKEMEKSGHRAGGVRLDSGDLAYLARRTRSMLDEAGLSYMKIIVSNQLDEHVIKSLLDQGAPIDVFGVGTRLVTGHPDASLDGVFKLSMSDGRPRIKLSENLAKQTLPGIKQVRRTFDANGLFFGADVITLRDEETVPVMYHPVEPGKSLPIGHLRQEPLLRMFMNDGRRVSPAAPVSDIGAYARERLSLLPSEYRRFENPHLYKVGLSEALLNLRTKTINMNRLILTALLFAFLPYLAMSQQFNGVDVNLGNLYRLSNARSRSISPENFTGAKGGGGKATTGTGAGAARDLGPGWKISPSVVIKAHTTFTLAEIDGPGSIQHIWMTPTGNWRYSILRVYWDDETTPSVEAPVGDFFCMGWGKYSPLQSLAVSVNPGSAFNCYWPMPFQKKCRITMENIDDANMTLYYQIDYILTDLPQDAAYFHARFHRVNRLAYKENYVLVDSIRGKGQYVGTYLAYGAHDNGWWGEGEIKFYMDGDTDYPTICGTGTEDYFCGSYDFDTHTKNAAGVEVSHYTEFCGPYSGLAQVIRGDGHYDVMQRFGLYRWHITDPIRFEKSLKVTIQDLGWHSGGRYLPLQDDISSVVYWYQSEPHQAFAPLPSKDQLEVN